MMQGQQRTKKTEDLSLIFFNIRASREAKTRRSWMRRARLALDKRDDLTAAERHEIMAVWSQRGVSHINSAALDKLHGSKNPGELMDWHNNPASKFLRASFLPNGEKKPRTKKPDAIAAVRLHSHFGPAANDSSPGPVKLRLVASVCIPGTRPRLAFFGTLV
jgi:hypothetical protein